jgi:hypothetical protein
LDENKAFSKISKNSAIKPKKAKTSLTALALYDLAKERGFWDIKNIDTTSIEFSLLLTAVTYENIYRFLGLNSSDDHTLSGLREEHLKELFQWVFSRELGNKSRVAESRHLSTFAKVVSTPAALEAFRAGISLQDAALYTDEIDDTFRTLVRKALNSMEQTHQMVLKITPNEPNLALLRSLKELVTTAGVMLKSKIENNDKEF